MNKKKVPTGIADLDPLLGGGFPEGKSYLITGEPGSGKSIFCIQFVLKALMQGERAVYVAVDEKPADVLEEASSLGWDLLQYIEKKNLLILDASPFFISRMGAGRDKDVDVQKTVGDLASYVKRMGATRVIIDPVRPLIDSRESAYRAQEYIRSLVHSLQDQMGTTNLLTSHAPAGAGGGVETSVEEYLVAGVVALRIVRTHNRLVRTLLVRKMRGAAIDLIEHEFTILREKGIVLKPTL